MASDEDKEIAFKVHNALTFNIPRISIGETIITALHALESDDFEQVINLLEPLRPHIKDNDQEIIQELLREARLGQEYAQIALLIKSSRLRQRGCQRYATFRETYPDHPDNQGLLQTCQPARTISISHHSSIDLMPKPFAWIDIPVSTQSLAFSIGKYPVTNAQFAKFIEADGYEDRTWWPKGNWRWGTGFKEPAYWKDSQWNDSEKPIVGISWFEATAFCNWLSYVTGEKITLPTEEQWRYAAHGDDRRLYPWGNDWDCTRCNNSVEPCENHTTTPVRHYEEIGESPFGVSDMAGNIWEWCFNAIEDVADGRNHILLGGSWTTSNHTALRCHAEPNNKFPNVRGNDMGFRIVRSHQS